MQVRRLLASSAALAVAAALLAGCSDESANGSPDPLPTSTPVSPSVSDTPSEPAEPTPPAAMERDDAEGAKAFAGYYWEVVNYAQATGDTKLLRALEMPGCVACRGGRESIEKVYAAGGRITGSQYAPVVKTATAIGRADTKKLLGFDVSVSLRYTAGSRLDSQGQTTRSQKAGRTSMTMSVYSDSPGWRLGGWER